MKKTFSRNFNFSFPETITIRFEMKIFFEKVFFIKSPESLIKTSLSF